MKTITQIIIIKKVKLTFKSNYSNIYYSNLYYYKELV